MLLNAWRRRAAFLILVAGALVGCEGSAAPSTSSGKLQLVATTGMIADLVRHVAGERASVIQLMSSGVDPHLYKPTSADIADIMRADAVFYNGLHLEGPMQETFERASQHGRVVTAVSSELAPSRIRYPSGREQHPDPHIWMDVGLWSDCLAPIVATLSKLAPDHAAEYQANAESFQVELKELDDYVRSSIASIPEAQRSLVTAHDAFGYFSVAYGIPVQSVQGITTESEAGVNDINALVAFLVEKKIPALFVESSVNDRNLLAVLEGVAQRGASVAIGGRLFSDAMGAEGTYEGTYIGMIDHNATAITRALGGTAPARGLHDKLTDAESTR